MQRSQIGTLRPHGCACPLRVHPHAHTPALQPAPGANVSPTCCDRSASVLCFLANMPQIYGDHSEVHKLHVRMYGMHEGSVVPANWQRVGNLNSALRPHVRYYSAQEGSHNGLHEMRGPALKGVYQWVCPNGENDDSCYVSCNGERISRHRLWTAVSLSDIAWLRELGARLYGTSTHHCCPKTCQVKGQRVPCFHVRVLGLRALESARVARAGGAVAMERRRREPEPAPASAPAPYPVAVAGDAVISEARSPGHAVRPRSPLTSGDQKRKREELVPGICAICMDDNCPRETVFTSCGHIVACLSCTLTLQRQLNRVDNAAMCPTCRIISLPVRVVVS